MIDIEAVKSYCRIDSNAEDALIQDLIDAAKNYLDGAGVPDPSENDPLYLLAIKALTLEYYDHRGLTETSAPHTIPGLDNVVVQLKLRAEAARILERGV